MKKNKIIPFIPVSDSKTQPPVFNNPEILNLYNYGTEIPYDILHQIIALPRESVIADLEKILQDAVDSYEYYSNEDWDETTNKIVFHAIYLLAELEAVESLPAIIAFLENDEEIIDFWLDEFLTDTYWQPLYKLGQNQLELFKKMLLTLDASIFPKISVSDAMVQMVLQIPGKRNEVLELYRKVLEYYKNHLIETDSEEDEFITYIAEDTAKCRLTELKSIVEDLYDKNLIYLNYLPLSQYLNLFENDNQLYFKDDVIDIFQTYQKINSESDEFYNNLNDDDFDDDFDDDDIDDNNFNGIKPLISHRTLNLDLPDFKHKIVEELFEHNMTISHDTLKTILELPREEIVADLINVIDFAINKSSNYCDHNSGNWDTSKTNFPLHAMYLLAEMREEKALDVIIKFLSIKDEYVEYWLGDFLTEEIWKILLLTGHNRLPDLAKVITNYEINEFVRYEASQAMAQTVFHFPDKRNEVISMFQDILNMYINNENADDVIADEILGGIIDDLRDINAIELLSLVKECYDKKLVDIYCTGIFEEFEEDLTKNKIYKNTIDDIFKTYDTIVTTWNSYTDDDDDLDNDNFNTDDDDVDDENNIVTNFDKPFTRESPKLGRNDPCFCGSGKKYKKCCLDK